MNIKTITTAAATIALGALLAGCSGSTFRPYDPTGPATPTVTVTQTIEASYPPAPVEEDSPSPAIEMNADDAVSSEDIARVAFNMVWEGQDQEAMCDGWNSSVQDELLDAFMEKADGRFTRELISTLFNEKCS